MARLHFILSRAHLRHQANILVVVVATKLSGSSSRDSFYIQEIYP
jgi:hypothetical protein